MNGVLISVAVMDLDLGVKSRYEQIKSSQAIVAHVKCDTSCLIAMDDGPTEVWVLALLRRRHEPQKSGQPLAFLVVVIFKIVFCFFAFTYLSY